MHARLLLPVALLILGVACGKTKEQTFDPPAVEPIEENQAEFPAGDDHPEELSFASGKEEEYHWAHAKGYVHASSAKVLDALLDPAVAVDAREVAEWEVTAEDVDDDVDFSMDIHHKVVNIITVEYDVRYLYALVDGTLEAPTQANARFDLTVAPPQLTVFRGSWVVRSAGDELSEVEFIEHLNAVTRDEETAMGTISDLYADILAFVDGEPLPLFD